VSAGEASWGLTLASVALGGVFALAGAIIGAKLTERREKRNERRGLSERIFTESVDICNSAERMDWHAREGDSSMEGLHQRTYAPAEAQATAALERLCRLELVATVLLGEDVGEAIRQLGARWDNAID
jgi:predicted phage-related endonuclease